VAQRVVVFPPSSLKPLVRVDEDGVEGPDPERPGHVIVDDSGAVLSGLSGITVGVPEEEDDSVPPAQRRRLISLDVTPKAEAALKARVAGAVFLNGRPADWKSKKPKL
jgi:hypothetical protein